MLFPTQCRGNLLRIGGKRKQILLSAEMQLTSHRNLVTGRDIGSLYSRRKWVERLGWGSFKTQSSSVPNVWGEGDGNIHYLQCPRNFSVEGFDFRFAKKTGGRPFDSKLLMKTAISHFFLNAAKRTRNTFYVLTRHALQHIYFILHSATEWYGRTILLGDECVQLPYVSISK